MVTIEQLYLQFDADGASDEAVFAALFARHIREWKKKDAAECERSKAAAQSRSLGDQQPKDY